MKSQETKKKPLDPFKRLKYMAFCRACTPPSSMNFEDFVNFVKSYLCFQTKTLFKDSIWDRYTDEELIVEYFTWIFQSNPERKQEFEASLGAGSTYYDDFLEFADKQIDGNKKELEDMANAHDDRLSFSPDVLGD